MLKLFILWLRKIEHFLETSRGLLISYKHTLFLEESKKLKQSQANSLSSICRIVKHAAPLVFNCIAWVWEVEVIKGGN